MKSGSCVLSCGALYVSVSIDDDHRRFFIIYSTVAKKNTTARKINSLSVISFLPYFVNKLLAFLM